MRASSPAAGCWGLRPHALTRYGDRSGKCRGFRDTGSSLGLLRGPCHRTRDARCVGRAATWAAVGLARSAASSPTALFGVQSEHQIEELALGDARALVPHAPRPCDALVPQTAATPKTGQQEPVVCRRVSWCTGDERDSTPRSSAQTPHVLLARVSFSLVSLDVCAARQRREPRTKIRTTDVQNRVVGGGF